MVLGVVGFLQISKLINKLGVAAVETGARRRAQTKRSRRGLSHSEWPGPAWRKGIHFLTTASELLRPAGLATRWEEGHKDPAPNIFDRSQLSIGKRTRGTVFLCNMHDHGQQKTVWNI